MSDYSFWHGDVRYGLGLVCLFNYSILQWQQAVWALENKRAVTKVERVCLMACWKCKCGWKESRSISLSVLRSHNFQSPIHLLAVCVCVFVPLGEKSKRVTLWACRWSDTHWQRTNTEISSACLHSGAVMLLWPTMCWFHSTQQCMRMFHH